MSDCVEEGALPMSYLLPVRATYALRVAKRSLLGTILWYADILIKQIIIKIDTFIF